MGKKLPQPGVSREAASKYVETRLGKDETALVLIKTVRLWHAPEEDLQLRRLAGELRGFVPKLRRVAKLAADARHLMTAAGRGVVGEGQFGQFRAKRAAVSDALDDMAYGALLNKERRELPSNLQTLARFGEMLSAQCSQIEARAVRPWEANGQLEPEQVKRATVQLVAEYLVTVSPMTAQLAALISIAAGIEPPTSKDNELELSLRKSVWHARLEAARKRITPGFRQARRQTTARERIQGPLFDEKTWRRWKQDPANADFRKSFLQWVRDPSNVEYLRILISKLKDTAPQH